MVKVGRLSGMAAPGAPVVDVPHEAEFFKCRAQMQEMAHGQYPELPIVVTR